MRKRILSIITSFLLIILATFAFIYAYYQTGINGWRQTYSISNIIFTMNGIKSDGDTHEIRGNRLDLEDGYNVNLNINIDGMATGSYAVKYILNFSNAFVSEGGSIDLAPAIEIYQRISGKYQFVGMLNELISNQITGYMGINDDVTLDYLLVYSPNAGNVYNNGAFDFKIEANYDVEVTGEHHNTYYINSSMVPVNSNISLFKRLANDAMNISGKTLVLTSDISLKPSEIVDFDTNVGLDLNGHVLNLNGGTINFNYSGPLSTADIYIRDSKGTGSIINAGVDGALVVNTPNDLILIDDNISQNLLDQITILNTSPIKFDDYVDRYLSAYANNILTSSTSNVDIDITKDLKAYLSKGYFTFNASKDDTLLTPTLDGTYQIARNNYTEIVYILTNTKLASDPTSEGYFTGKDLTILGMSSFALGQNLIDNLPTVISSSLFLPTYDVATNAKYTWITSDHQLLTTNGVFLNEGYSILDNFKDKSLKLGVIVECNGEREAVYSDELVVEIFSIDERMDIFNDYFELNFDEIGATYSYSIAETTINKLDFTYNEFATYMNTKYGVAIPSAPSNEVVDAYVTNRFGSSIVADENYDRTLYVNKYQLETIAQDFAYKLGLESIIIDNNTLNVSQNIYLNEGLENYYLHSANYNSSESYVYSYLTLLEKPTLNSMQFEITAICSFKQADDSISYTTANLTKLVTLVATAAETEIIDPLMEIRRPFLDYEARMKVLENDYESKFNILDRTSKDTAITYQIISPSFGEGVIPYVYLANDGEVIEDGITTSTTNPAIHIREGLVPNTDSEVTIKATVDTQDYYVTFTIPGLLHNEDADIKDSNLYFKLIGLCDANDDGWLSVKEAEAVASISISNAKIETIKGIEYFKNLTSLTLSKNNFVDITYISNLNDLINLDLSGNKITDISPLKMLDKIRTLKLTDNLITDISPIRYLTSISDLFLNNSGSTIYNNIISFEPLSNYNCLRNLYIKGNASSSTDETKYYLTMIYNNTVANLGASKGTKTHINDNTSSSDNLTHTPEERVAVEILRNIVSTTETYNTLILPLEYEYEGATYSVQYTSDDPSVITFDNTNGTYTITQPIVDTGVKITIQISKGASTYTVARIVHIDFLQSPALEDIAYIETESGVYQRLIEVVPDSVLRKLIYNNFNTNSSNTIVTTINSIDYSERNVLTLTECQTLQSSTLDWKDKGITDLTGIGYFTGINTLNISNNKIDSLAPLQDISGLKELTISGMQYDFDELVFVPGTTTKNNAFVLERLNIEGCYGLEEEETLTSLYHVYKNNYNGTFVKVYMTDTDIWDPFILPLTKYLQSLTNYVAFSELGDHILLDKKHDITFYDDDIPVTFNLSKPSFKHLTMSEGTYAIADKKSGCLENIDQSTTWKVNYKKLVGFNDSVYATLILANGSQTINGTTYNINATATGYMTIKLDYDTTYYVRFEDSSMAEGYRIEKLSTVFPGRTLREAVIRQLQSEVFTPVASVDEELTTASFYKQENTLYKIVTVAGLGELTITSIKTDGTHEDGSCDIIGARYIKNLKSYQSLRDINLGNGADLINFTTLTGSWFGLDLSNLDGDAIRAAAVEVYGETYVTANYSDTLNLGLLPLETLDCTNNVGSLLYDKSSTTTNYDDKDVYYFNYFPKLVTLKIIRASDIVGDKSGIVDFYGLRAFASGSSIKTLHLQGNNGSLATSTQNILTQIYANSDATGKDFKISSAMNNTGNVSFSQTYSQLAAIRNEYNELAPNILDLGLLLNGSLHYMSTTQLLNANNTITIPVQMNPYKVKVAGGNDLIIKTYDEEVIESYRLWDIDWYVCCSNIDTFKSIFPNITVNSTGTPINTGSSLKKYSITNTTNITDTVVAPTYDYYFYFEGVIGNSVDGTSISLTEYAFDYPVLVKGSSAYSSSYKYTINSVDYYSYRMIDDFSLRMMVFCGLEAINGGFNSSLGGLIESSKAVNVTKISYNSTDLTIGTTGSLTLSALNNGQEGGYRKVMNSIITLNGLEIFTNVTSISLPSKQIADISALSAMTNLATINLGSNNIFDITPLKDLTHLVDVNLNKNNIDTTYYVDGNGNYVSIFKNSINGIDNLDFSYNSAITYEDIYVLAGDYNPAIGQIVTNRANSINLLKLNYTYDCTNPLLLKALKELLNNDTTNLVIEIGLDYNSDVTFETTKNAIMTKISNLESLYDSSLVVQGYSNSFASTYVDSFELANSSIGSINTQGYVTLNTNLSNMMGEFKIPIKYTSTIGEGSFETIIEYSVYRQATYSSENLYIQIGGTSYDNNNVYKVSGNLVQAKDIFEPNLLTYFINSAKLDSNGTVEATSTSDKLIYYKPSSNDACLVFSDYYTSINITDNHQIKSLKGLELITQLGTINIANNPISELPSFTNNNIATTELILESSSTSLGYLTKEELSKLFSLTGLTNLSLGCLDGEFDEIATGQTKSFKEWVATQLSNLTSLRINLGGRLYEFDSTTKKLMYSTSLLNLQKMFGVVDSTNIETVNTSSNKLFAYQNGKNMNGFVSISTWSNYVGGLKNNSNIVKNTYGKVISSYYSNAKAALVSDLNETYPVLNGDEGLFNKIFSMNESSSNAARWLEYSPLTEGAVYNLPISLSYYGIPVTINWTSTSDKFVIVNNILTVGTSTGVPSINFSYVASDGNEHTINSGTNVNVNTIIADKVSNAIVGECYVEYIQGHYKKASDIFDSTRLIYMLFNNSFSATTNCSTNDTSDTSVKTITLDGTVTPITTQAKYVLDYETEIEPLTKINMSNPGITSIKGMEYYINLINFTFTNSALSSIEPLRNLTLTKFEYSGIVNGNFLISDFSPLFNSRGTLTSFIYGSGNADVINMADMSFLMGFGSQLVTIKLSGVANFDKTIGFQYMLSWFNIYRPGTTIYFGNKIAGASSYTIPTSRGDYKQAANIMNALSINTADIVYQNNFELRMSLNSNNNFTGVLPNKITYGGVDYDIEWRSYSSIIDVTLNANDEYDLVVNNPRTNPYNMSYVECILTLNGCKYSRILTIQCMENPT